MKTRIRRLINDQSGVAVVYTALALTVLCGMVALSVDVGHWYSVRNELHNAADACSLAGARGFYPYDVTGEQKLDPDPGTAMAAATGAITLNRADARDLTDLPSGDVQVGIWNYTARTMEAWVWPPEFGSFKGPAVALTTRKEGGLNAGPAANYFGQIFGINTTDITSQATAALSGVGGYHEGAGILPIAVNKSLLRPDAIINFKPDSLDVGGWTSLSEDTASAAYVKGLINGSIDTPAVSGDSEIKLINGVACTAVKELIRHYGMVETPPGSKIYKPLDSLGNLVPIKVMMPAVEVDKFNQSAKVVGGCCGQIIEARDSPYCEVKFEIKDREVGIGTQGGGPYYGLMSLEPKLVQ